MNSPEAVRRAAREKLPLDQRQVEALENIADSLARLSVAGTQIQVALANLQAAIRSK